MPPKIAERVQVDAADCSRKTDNLDPALQYGSPERGLRQWLGGLKNLLRRTMIMNIPGHQTERSLFASLP